MPILNLNAIVEPLKVNSVLLLDGSKAMTGNLNMGSNKITNLATPTANTDAATKAYVDSAAASASSLHVYSTTEKVVGKWIDGKDVYERTFSGTLSTTEKTVQLFSAGYVDMLISAIGYIKNTYGGYLYYIPIPISYMWNSTTGQAYVMTSSPNSTEPKGSDIVLQHGYSAQISGGKYHVTLRYTKA